MKTRKTNESKLVDPSCGNNGTCKWCRGNRLHSSERHLPPEVAIAEQLPADPFEPCDNGTCPVCFPVEWR